MTRQVKVELVIDDKGSVKVIHKAGEESEHAEGKLKHLDKGVKELGKSFGGLKGMIGMGLGAIGIGGAGLGLESIISKTSEVAAETEKFHAITGIGAQSSLDYTAALKARGVGAEAGANAFKFLAKNIQLAERQEHTFATGQTSAAEKGKVYTSLLGVQANAFKELGINVKEFGSLSEQGKFELITKKFEGMADGAQKTRLAVQLFGRGGTAMLPVLDKGALSLNHFDQMAKKFFPTLKGEGVQSLEELKEKQAESKMAREGLEFTLGMKLIPAVSAVTSWFSKLILEVEKGHGVWGTLGRDVEGVAVALKAAWGWLEHNQLAVKGLEGVLGVLAGAWAVDKVLAFARAIKSLYIIQGVVSLIKFLAGGDVLLTLQVGFLDAAGGISAFALATAGALAPFLAIGAAIAAIVFGVKELNKILPPGSRPENLLGGNQPGESRREDEGTARRLGLFGGHHRTARQEKRAEPRVAAAAGAGGVAGREALIETAGVTPAQILSQIQAIAKEEHTTKVDLHLGALQVAEAIIRDPRAERRIAEGVAHYVTKRAARQ